MRQVAHTLNNFLQRFRLQPYHLDPQFFQQIDLTLRITTTPCQHDIGFQRENALDVNTLPASDVLNFSGGGWKIRIAAEAYRGNSGGESQLC
ncbi:hypothetical protein SAMN05216516_10340 [Izhakiella capsodis]|uniref:Uncharacterized protein n=1 Tax=Izhakiella capsodis TaxID=1367852 RepID=A0A1I4WS53_9GAMM|nr:hypothetical protein SAMN05216516_10340 [Izhakiella capsodis]